VNTTSPRIAIIGAGPGGLARERAAPIAEGANGAIVEQFAAGGPEMDNLPDFDAEAEQWKADAEAYGAARAG
jgi:hypothetical protein